jgi:hypothetical protein
MSRQYTIEECRDMFMKQVATIAAYWARQPDMTPHERCTGVAFSILSMIDGSNLGVPSFDLVPREGEEAPAFDVLPCGHEEDKAWYQEQGENWWPRVPDSVRETLPVINDTQLHEFWHSGYEPAPPPEDPGTSTSPRDPLKCGYCEHKFPEGSPLIGSRCPKCFPKDEKG